MTIKKFKKHRGSKLYNPIALDTELRFEEIDNFIHFISQDPVRKAETTLCISTKAS